MTTLTMALFEKDEVNPRFLGHITIESDLKLEVILRIIKQIEEKTNLEIK